ncbi:MAG: DUF1015 domain-containing protein [Gammaproteobacteria bacterium]|nr:DUF1015 domain-containing protein [Gammaproteobacteria bacterium]
MKLLSPFRGLRPVADRVADVIAPPYDVVNTAEARELARNRPWSFLHVSKPEIDLPQGTNPYDESVYQRGAENFAKMIDEGILVRDDEPCYYIYELTMGEHVQTGIAAAASIEAYDKNIIRKHESTRPVKEDDRVKQIRALRAQTGPVFLTYRQRDDVDQLVEQKKCERPVYDLTSEDGVRHRFWVIDDTQRLVQFDAVFSHLDYLYIADGHHRSAAASRVCAMNEYKLAGNRSCKYFLAVLFPDDQVEIIDYNRVIADLNGLSKEEFLSQVAKSFDIEKSAAAVKPGSKGLYGMYLDGQWYCLTIHDDLMTSRDSVEKLDVQVLDSNLIAPILNISDPRYDTRIDFVGGIRGLDELEKRVNSGEMVLAFSLYPTGLDELMAVADAGKVMPPKSTWFEPKLADGLVSYVLD